jgi:N-acetylglucosaminyldiphosphoundecaprenol N-acetyl-beta-D-mannosaminyltransferase
MGVDVHAITQQQAIDYILSELDCGRPGMLVTPNLDHLYRSTKDLSFAALVAEADLVVADGMPLVWAARVQDTPLPARVAGSDLIWSLSEAAARRGRSVFLLGGDPGTADAAARVLTERYANLRIAGTFCPPFGFDRDPGDVANVAKVIADARPDIVFVALGSPKQERLICRIRQALPHAWWLGVGISFSFVCGEVKRAPVWMQRTGTEWVHRLLQEPRRLFRRYIVVGLPFAGMLMASSAWRRLVGVPSKTSSRRQYRRATGPAPASWRVATPPVEETAPAEPEYLIITRPMPAPVEAEAPGANGNPEPSRDVSTHTRARNLNRLRAVILLGGAVRATPLHNAVKRSILDLPLEQDLTIFNHWLGHAADLARYAGVEKLPVRVLVNRQSFEPTSGAARHAGSYTVERDVSEYRGTGGVLRDLAQHYDDDDLVLVATASQVLLDPLAAVAAALDHKHGDVNLISHRDGTPSGVMLARVATLRMIPAIGFFDMKEQALPLIAGRYDVKVVHCRKPTGLPVRTLADYLGALRAHHRRRAGRPLNVDPLAEDWQSSFAIVEAGASVPPDVYLHDSVVLRGSMVEPGASLVRSVVCPGAVVRQRASIIDRFVMP